MKYIFNYLQPQIGERTFRQSSKSIILLEREGDIRLELVRRRRVMKLVS